MQTTIEFLLQTIKISLCLLCLFVVLHIISVSAQAQTTLFQVKVNGKIGFIDKTGKIIIKPRFELVSGFYEGLSVVGLKCGDWYNDECEWDYVNESGKKIF